MIQIVIRNANIITIMIQIIITHIIALQKIVVHKIIIN